MSASGEITPTVTLEPPAHERVGIDKIEVDGGHAFVWLKVYPKFDPKVLTLGLSADAARELAAHLTTFADECGVNDGYGS